MQPQEAYVEDVRERVEQQQRQLWALAEDLRETGVSIRDPPANPRGRGSNACSCEAGEARRCHRGCRLGYLGRPVRRVAPVSCPCSLGHGFAPGARPSLGSGWPGAGPSRIRTYHGVESTYLIRGATRRSLHPFSHESASNKQETCHECWRDLRTRRIVRRAVGCGRIHPQRSEDGRSAAPL